MRVVCDNCGAVYKIPESKLVREVNKATCRKCGHGIIIRKTSMGEGDSEPDPADSEATQITSADELEARARAQQTAAAGMPSGGFGHFGGRQDLGLAEEVVPPTVVNQPSGQEQTVPRAGRSVAALSQNAVPLPAQVPTPRPQLVPQTTAPPPPAPAVPAMMSPPVAASFDPSGDMTLVMMGCFGCLVGSAVLATSEGSVLLGAVGLSICVGSAVTSLLVLVTGDRGRKEARVFLSMFLALFFAGGAGGSWYLFSAATGLMDQLANLELPTGIPTPDAQVGKDPTAGLAEEAASEPLADAEEGDPLTELGEEDTAVEAEPEEPPPKKSYTAKYTNNGGSTTSGGSTTTSGGSTTTSGGSTTTSWKAPEKEPTPEPPKPTSQGVPVTVLDTMLKSNKGVKTCFGRYRAETGSLPSGRITVELTVQPNGRATQARIDGGAYAGTSLDSCLSDAIKAITFPPWDGSEGLTYYYPFILN